MKGKSMTRGNMILTLLVAAGAAFPLLAYVPEPQPVKSAVEITAIYYPGTEQMSEWDMIAQTCPERKPLLGWFDEGNPEAIDWQIKWAVEHGISSFCVDWYWNKGFRRLEHWVKGYYKAHYRKYLKWYMMYANHNQPGAHSTEDQIAVTRYWIDNYFKTPEYYKIDGKPVVCYWDAGNLDRDFIAEAAANGEKLKDGEGIRRAFAISEKMAREAGLPGIHWQSMGGRRAPFSSAISYGLSNRMLKARAAARGTGLTFDLFTEAIRELWLESAQQGVAYWLPIPTGWDDRPRSFSRSTIIRGRTPEKFAAICREAWAFCDRNGLRHAVIHPINEWQEGSYIEPNEEYGFAMYDALRDAFCEKPASGWPKNIKPSDVGLGPYDYPPLFRSAVQHWEFADSVEGWYRQPYGGGELEAKDGSLNFWITWRNNFNIRQRVMPFAASKYGRFRIRMKITPNGRVGLSGEKNPSMLLKWGTEDNPIIGPGLAVDRNRCVACCPVKVDGKFHEYAIDLSSNPDWRGKVDELWFEACQIKHARVAIDWMRFESAMSCAADFDVRAYGARGDGVAKDTKAIQSAIDAAAHMGGGTVRIGSGTYLTGSLYLKSGVDLFLDNATLRGSPDKEDYNAVDVCPQNWSSKAESASGAHLLLCIEQTNVTVRGTGRIDGNCTAFLLGPDGKPWPGGQSRIPWRPSQMLYFVESENVRVEGVSLVDSPYWSCFFHGCRRVVARNLCVRTRREPFHTHNGDGIDIDCCENVEVVGCDINTADDSITLRADVVRLKHSRPCAHVRVANCRLSSACNAVRIGVGDGEVRNAVFKDIEIYDTRTAVDVVSSWRRGGRGADVNGVLFDGMNVESVLFCRIRPNFAKESRIANIRFANVKGRTECASWITGREENPIGMIAFENVSLPHGVFCLNATDVRISGGAFARNELSADERSAFNSGIREHDRFPCVFRGSLYDSIQNRRGKFK